MIMMGLLSLDEYSIREVFKYLDIESRVNLCLTCKRFKDYGKHSINTHWNLIEDGLRQQLVECLCNQHNRDNVPYNLEYQYVVSMSLKYLLQVMDICQRIDEKCSTTTVADQSMLGVNELLLWNAISSPVESGFSHLVKLGHRSHIDFNHWYMFNNAPGRFLFLCCAKHPDQKMMKSSSVGDVVMGITYNSKNKKSKFSVCLSSRFDWFGPVDEVSE